MHFSSYRFLFYKQENAGNINFNFHPFYSTMEIKLLQSYFLIFFGILEEQIKETPSCTTEILVIPHMMEAVPHHLSVSRLCYLGLCWYVHWWAHNKKNHCVDIFHNGSLSLNNMARWFLLRKTAWKDNEKLFIEISQKNQKVKKNWAVLSLMLFMSEVETAQHDGGWILIRERNPVNTSRQMKQKKSTNP